MFIVHNYKHYTRSMPMAAIASEYKRAGDSIRTSLYLLSGDIVQ